MYRIGIISSPGVAHRYAERIIPKVKRKLNQLQNDDWHFEVVVDMMIGTAEDIDKGMDKIANIKANKQWDFAIGIIDLPNISDGQIVVSDVNHSRATAYISLPSLGFLNITHKLTKMISSLMTQFVNNESDHHLKIHPLAYIKKVQDTTQNNDSQYRYINATFIIAWIQLICGLTRANEPWKAITNFKKIISVAFATGTYVAIFSMPWQLSVIYSPIRFIILMIIAIVGMSCWLLYAHQLFERQTSDSQKIYRTIYNITTLLTLMVITFISYAILYILLSISVTLFVPNRLFNAWTTATSAHTFSNYLKLIWFVSSLGLLAGAMGSTVESEEKVRRLTYSYRQYYRYKQAEEDEQQQFDYNKKQIKQKNTSSNDQSD
ncbi:5,10-methylene-tetrahydrofolate dehydrogenase [Staphylococcus simiae]|uniref:5,10-methylene-tetrahydrofolate dehydrogenase n=1 Tax=Staphylococcus simiae TaxID=308354 RepID=UPI001A95885A|nr:5,10-methylene-tetrahydrofolate dehydrogenase [Staphylococcus simiae]MBO1199864.1 5,10-methylene-tetrahydrofolate dehydrogenase [Staphylococcus simiae]MBO1202125.1 5,10-methylene-tetrahydrofolate dehydrogenase [Staphylococcus simiae]MBO1204391.1 5,10-methylene-tetrahydrofolate dehydrogenase [Staphylococcus simiae]MBO1211931.1 5,10-methylene-tetrahydrofolate dehydrogenase [Staphylococcus simiae]MBO1230568.1 5,10-methylene-tetrahydrofolate dehydrogenase [Staphylococcus simiae]